MKATFIVIVVIVVISLVECITCTALSTAGPGYEIHCIGNCDKDVQRNTTACLGMMGGAQSPEVMIPGDKDAYLWWIKHANGGDVVILTAVPDSDCDWLNKFMFDLSPVNSVTTVCFRSKEGSYVTSVLERILQAEAIFFTGGDQSKYYDWWLNTPVADAISHLVSLHRPFAGSSAGLAIQGQMVYTALNGGVDSEEALNNPFNKYITLTNHLFSFPAMHGLIADTHFRARDRMGRLVAFLARIIQQGWVTHTAHAVGINEHTTVAVDEHGLARFFGAGPVYFLHSSHNATVCRPDQPLVFSGVSVWRWAGEKDAVFDMNQFQPVTHDLFTSYSISAAKGTMSSTQPGGSVY